MTKHVAVLLGGRSAERAVSEVSGHQCAQALERKGYHVTRIDPQDSDWISQLIQTAPDVVFNGLHGPYGEDGRIQGVLDCLGLAYTHSGVAASALAMDKQKTKAVLSQFGVLSPKGMIVKRFEAADRHVMDPPYVAKPNDEGSSFGIIIVPEGASCPSAELSHADWPYGDDVLIEQYIPGRELTVAVMGERGALAVTEIIPQTNFYDFQAKYTDGGSTHKLPADIPKEIEKQCLEMALLAHKTLKCRGLTRSDFRYDPKTNKVWLLEINTQPGMTPTSLAPEQAAHCGISFEDLVEWMVEEAICDS